MVASDLPFVRQSQTSRLFACHVRAGRISTGFRILLAGGVGRRRARVAREHAKRGRDRFGEFSQTLGQFRAAGRAAAAEQSAGSVQCLGEFRERFGRGDGRGLWLGSDGRAFRE